MKKTLVSALTTALVVGAASTTFAAANPFSDVPADSWAYDAVTQLAADGVIDGYPDGTFRGERNITRYEMAQMIAKAMAKTDVSAADKAMIDKLAAEFADELNNLGVRVANLERNADMVKWNGEARYTIARHNVENSINDDHTNELLLRLEPSAEVNSNWHVNARIDAKLDAATDRGENNDSDAKLTRLWAQGDYDKFQAKLGRFAPIDNDSIMDTQFTGAEVSYGKDFKVTVGGGRLHSEDSATENIFNDVSGLRDASDYIYAGLGYDNGKLNAGVDYHHIGLSDYDDAALKGTKADDVNLWLVKAGYRFDKNFGFNGYYAQADDEDWLGSEKSGSIELDYKGAEQENAGTWGAWVAYRHLGTGATPFNTFDALSTNEKGWEIGANYTFFKNIVGEFRYGNGEKINTIGDDVSGNDVHTYFGRLYFMF